MSYEMAKCKITVLRRSLDQELADQYLDVERIVPCEQFKDGQEFIVDHPFYMPKEFGCSSAWADLRSDVMLIASGGNLSWIKPRGTAISACSDRFRTVFFKIERIN